MYLIIIDTTELFRDPLLAGPDWSLVKIYLHRNMSTLIVPDIVLDEAKRHYRDKLKKAISDARRSLGSLRQLIPNSQIQKFPKIDIEEAEKQYEDSLKQRLSNLNAKGVPYNRVSVHSLVQRSLACRKPFDSRGHRGFRDAILWESILQCLKGYKHKAIFITDNSTDFGNHNSIDRDLEADLVSHKLSSDAVTVCKDIQTLVNEKVKPTLQELDDIQELLNSGKHKHFSLERFYEDSYAEIQHAVETVTASWDFSELGRITSSNFKSPELQSLKEEPDEITVGSVYRADKDGLFFSALFSVMGLIRATEIDSSNSNEPPFESEFYGHIYFHITITIMMENSTGTVLSSHIDDVLFQPCIMDWSFDPPDV